MKKVMPIKSVLIFFIILIQSTLHAGEPALWDKYVSTFVSLDGRVVDYFQDKVSHSEGQGYGMLLAVAHDDKKSFNKIWKWTRDNLAKRKDNLFVWQWGERPNSDWDVLDYNNATDGDILIAYALLKAGQKWKKTSYTKRGLDIVAAMREKLAVSWQGHTLLLPGYEGFQNGEEISINPAYFILPAYRLFAKVDDKKFWDKVYSDSVSIVNKSQFGIWGLPSDWIKLSKSGIKADTKKSPYFGYSAVRILLYLSYETNPPYPEGLDKIFFVYDKMGYIPLNVDVKRDSLSLVTAPAGFYAIYAFAAKRSGHPSLSKTLFKEAEKVLSREEKSYYSFVLYLLATSEDLFD